MISRKSAITVAERANFSIFLICLIAGVELTLASKSCKNTVMKIVMKQCSNAATRSRRASNDFDGMNPSTIDGDDKIDVEKVIVILDKLRDMWMDSNMSTTVGLSNSVPTDKPYKSHLRMRAVERPMRGKRDSLPDPRGDDLGFALTRTEVEELYSEFFERPHRQPSKTPDEAKAAFLDIAAKCCQNEAECLRGKIIDCP